MTDHIDDRAQAIEDVFTVALEPHERRELLALLWDWNSEDWERGVMWSRMLGSIPPPRPPNPYRDSP